MKNRGLILSAAVLVFLCLVYVGTSWFMDHSEKQRLERMEEERIYMTDLPDIQTISYNNNGLELSFTKEGDSWYYDGDKDFPLQQSRISALAGTVQKLEAVRRLDGGDDFSAYGVDNPVREVKATSSDGNSVVIKVGNSTEEGNYYAVKEGDTTAYLIGSSLFDETGYGLDELIALEEFPSITGTDIQEIHMTKDGASWDYIKKEDSATNAVAWYQGTPDLESNRLESNSQLNVLADTISGFTVSKCAHYKAADESLERYGLLNPSAKISYNYLMDGEIQSLTLSIGGLNGEGTSYYTRTEGSPAVNEIDKAIIDKCFSIMEEVAENS